MYNVKYVSRSLVERLIAVIALVNDYAFNNHVRNNAWGKKEEETMPGNSQFDCKKKIKHGRIAREVN